MCTNSRQTLESVTLARQVKDEGIFVLKKQKRAVELRLGKLKKTQKLLLMKGI